MMNISKPMSPAALVAYHENSGDYWIEGGTAPSQWGGRLAQDFGLSGEIDKEHFERLCYGRDPFTNEKLKPGKDGNRGGYDITFSAPKEISLAYLRLRQTDPKAAERLLNQFLQSTEQSMGEMEKEAAVQSPKRGEPWQTTGNWLWARYLHFDSRPDEKTGMPVIQIHAHYVVFNLTKSDRGMRALEIGNLKSPKSMKATEGSAALHMAEWHSDLARRLKDMGAGIKRTKSIGFGIEGISRELVDKWSPRRATIMQAKERIAEAQGITDPERLRRLQAELAKITRKHKQKDLSRDELWAYWDSQLTKADQKALDSIWGKKGWETDAHEALRYSLEHNLHRSSVVSEKRLLIDALKYGVGSVSAKDLKAEYQNLGVLLKDGEITTREVLDQEGRIIDFAREGRGTMRPLAPVRDSNPLSTLAAAAESKTATLSLEQQAAIRHVWSSTDQVILIRGGAGTGKTTMMKTAIAGIDNPVAVLAPSAEASRGVLRKEGFECANTVASFLNDNLAQQETRNGVIWVDEAGLLAVADLDRLCGIAKELNARLVLQGDPKQHKSVARHGNMFKVLQDYAGLPLAELKDIKRQKGKHKEAVAAIQNGDILKGHDILDKMGAIKHVSGNADIVNDFLRVRHAGQSVLVVAPTHAVGDAITSEIRLCLRQKNDIGEEERKFTQYRNLGWSDAQKSDLDGYEGNEVIQFFRNDGSFRAGQKYGVGDLLSEQQRKDRRHRGPKSTKPAFVSGRFSVYSEGEIGLSAGDRIRITAGGKTLEGKEIDNGDTYTVSGFTDKGDIALTNGSTLSKSFGHIAHAYTTTSYGAQGRTVDHVLVAMNRQTAPALNAEQFYVSASRGRKSATIYTDMNPAEMRSLIRRQDSRKSATELMGRHKKKPSRIKELARRARQAVVRRLYEQQQCVIPPEIPRRKIERSRGHAR